MDRELVVAAQRGDQVAFMDLIRVRVDRLFGIARRILRDVDRAEDALQDALVIAWRDLPDLRDPDRFDFWIQRVLTNMCIEHARRDRRRYAKLEVLNVDGHRAQDDIAGVVDRDVVDRDGACRNGQRESRRAVRGLRFGLGRRIRRERGPADRPLGDRVAPSRIAIVRIRSRGDAAGQAGGPSPDSARKS